jgi:hypothetical protein
MEVAVRGALMISGFSIEVLLGTDEQVSGETGGEYDICLSVGVKGETSGILGRIGGRGVGRPGDCG